MLDPMQAVNFVESADDVGRFWEWLSHEPLIATDTETSGFNFYDPRFKIRLIQFGSPNDAWVVDFQRWRGLVEDVFRRYDGIWVMHHSRFDSTALAREGVHVPLDRVHDTLVMLRLARPTESAGLKNAAQRYVSGASADAQKILADAFRRQGWSWETVPTDFPPFRFYAALDPILTARLYHTDVAREGRESPVYGLEMEVRAVCTRMEQNGVRVDGPFCVDTARKLRDRAECVKDEIDHKYGILVTSSSQLSHWFATQTSAVEWMTKETAGGKLSVDKEVLTMLASLGGEVGDVATAALSVRRDEKIASAYLDNFIGMRDGDDLIHPQIETIAARTGRMSVKDPGLQTLPKPSIDSDYRTVREAVIARDDDRCIVACDFDQIELRLAASMSRDPGLIGAFELADSGDTDFFTALARGVYADPTLVKSDKRRDRIKTFSYASLYGASVRKMAISAGVPVHEMRDVRDDIAVRYPGFFSVMLEIEHEAKTNGGYIETLYGRRLPIPAGKTYVATNYKVQGSAADVMKRALVTLAQAGFEEYMLLPVHDEVVFDIPSIDVDDARAAIRDAMRCDDFAVPLTADPSAGCRNWADTK